LVAALAPLVCGVLLPGSALAEPLFLSVSPRDAVLRTIDAANGTTVAASVTITLANPSPPPDNLVLTGVPGLARHPQTDTLYALVRIQGRTNPDLVTLDEWTGVATSLGNTTQKFAGITFASDGTLYAVSGDGAIVPERLFTLNTTDASATLITDLGDGSDGETIAFNPDDGLIYHASGIGMPNQSQNGEIFQTIDPDTLAVTDLTLSGFDYEELTALAFSGGGFFAGDLGDSAVDMPRFFRVTTGGAVTFLGDMDHVSKGFAPPLAPPAVPALQAAMVAALSGLLLMLGCRSLRAAPST
jgi:hypothetical protein